MCKPKSVGGRRCAAGTRGSYNRALERIYSAANVNELISAEVEGMSDIALHATTPTGRADVTALRNRVDHPGQQSFVKYLDKCLTMSDEFRSGFDEIEARIKSASLPVVD